MPQWKYLPKTFLLRRWYFPAIVGTFSLVIGAMLVPSSSVYFSCNFLAEYGKSGRFRHSSCNSKPAGVPSCLRSLRFGLFVIFLDWNVTNCRMVYTGDYGIPVVITAGEESLRSIPQGFRESSLALGHLNGQWFGPAYCVLGILTSSILGVARVCRRNCSDYVYSLRQRTIATKISSIGLTFSFREWWHYLPIYVVSAKIPQNEYTADMQYGTAFVFLALVIVTVPPLS